MNNDREDLNPLQREAHGWVARFLRGDATANDLTAVKDWHARSPEHAAAYAKARHLWRELGAVAYFRKPSDAGASHQARGVDRRFVLGGALAGGAAVAGAYAIIDPPLGLWPSLAQMRADYRTQTGQQRKIAIADRIAVELNTQTSVAVHALDGGGEHIELIAGEAMISVANVERPLIVSVAQGRIIASHAKFNLRYDRDVVCVTCLDGSVKVEAGLAAAALAPGQQISYLNKDIAPRTQIDPNAVTAWQRGLLIFEFTPVADAIKEVNRYRPGRIVLLNAAIGRRLLNARFRISEADQIIGQIVQIYGAKPTFLPGGLVFLT